MVIGDHPKSKAASDIRASEPIRFNVLVGDQEVGNWANLSTDARQSSGEEHRAKERTHDDAGDIKEGKEVNLRLGEPGTTWATP